MPEAVRDPAAPAAPEAWGLLEGAQVQEAFQRLTALLRAALDASAALVTLVGPGPRIVLAQAGEAPADPALDGHAACRRVVESGAAHLDERAGTAAYAGVPLRAPDGEVLGTVSALAPPTRTWSPEDLTALHDIARAATTEIGLSLATADVERVRARADAIVAAALDAIVVMDEDGMVLEFNPAAEQLFGHAREQAVGSELAELIIPQLSAPSTPSRCAGKWRRASRGSSTGGWRSRPCVPTAPSCPSN